MPKIDFLPLNRTVEAKEGESVLDAALRQGIKIVHACGGFGACTTCHVVVKSGEENLSEIQNLEEERLDRATDVTLHSRLACQAKVHGDVTVEIKNLER